MKTEILIIDDHMSLHDPFVRSIRKNRPEAVVTVLDDAGKGVEYISNDLSIYRHDVGQSLVSNGGRNLESHDQSSGNIFYFQYRDG